VRSCAVGMGVFAGSVVDQCIVLMGITGCCGCCGGGGGGGCCVAGCGGGGGGCCCGRFIWTRTKSC
jgi:hypothetical protein